MAGTKTASFFLIAIFYTMVDAAIPIFHLSSPNLPAPNTSVPVSPSYPSAPTSPPYPAPTSRGIKAAYWPSFDGFPLSSIDTSYFTHIYYAFLLPDPGTYKLAITPNDQQMLPQFTSTLLSQYPPVKTILSIGGGGNDPKVFSTMAKYNSTRDVFINSTIEVARKYGFDGVDLDWEFPANQEDMINLGILFKEWRKELDNEAKVTGRPRLLLTSAVYYASKFASGEPRSYLGQPIRKYVDWVSPMCFDYHGSWDNVTGENAPLYDPASNISTSYGIQSWIDAGVPTHKLVMGLPMYGRTWKLKDPSVNGVGAPAVGVGPGDVGILVYWAVIDFNSKNNATVVYDAERVSMYSFAGDSWIGYDDVMSITVKVQFARSHRLGGYFFWALGQDMNWTISRQASSTWDK